MPFAPGEKINVRFEGDPATSVLLFGGYAFSVANGGLKQMPDGGLIAEFHLPGTPGAYPYTFSDRRGSEEHGHWRVVQT